MKRPILNAITFTELYSKLDHLSRDTDKVRALRAFVNQAEPLDSAWAIYLLSGSKLPRIVSGPVLREWASEASNLPLWLIEESYKASGDLAEALSHVVQPSVEPIDISLFDLIERHAKPLDILAIDDRKASVLAVWIHLPTQTRTIYNKLLTGTFRSPISMELVAQALAELTGASAETIELRLASEWQPDQDSFSVLTASSDASPDQLPTLSLDLETIQESPDEEAIAAGKRLIAVLIYVQQARGTADAEYTFGVWDGGKLVPVVKTAAGIRATDRTKIDRHTRANTLERFGPVRTVAPTLVFELDYESVRASNRTKSGVAIDSPRILQVLPDVRPEHVDSLDSLKAKLPIQD